MYNIGDTVINNSGVKAIILDKKCYDLLGNNKKRSCYLIEYIETKYSRWYRTDSVHNGKFKDIYAPKIAGVGCIGNASYAKNKHKYNTWSSMIKRCYDESNVGYDAYNSKGVYVCERWHCFEYFLEDIEKIEGWDKCSFENNKLSIDKDFKQSDIEYGRVYSLETCIFLTKEINSILQYDGDVRYFKAISPDGDMYIDYNREKFSKSHDLNTSNISCCLNNSQMTHLGWKFSYIDSIDGYNDVKNINKFDIYDFVRS